MRAPGLTLIGVVISSLLTGSVAAASENQDEAARAWVEFTSQVYADRGDWESLFVADHDRMSKKRLRATRQAVREQLDTLRAIGRRPCYGEAYDGARLGSLRLIGGITDLLKGREGLGHGSMQIHDGADMIRFYWDAGDYGHCSVKSIVPDAVPHLNGEARDMALAALFPSSIDGRDINVTTYGWSDWLTTLDPLDPDDARVIEQVEAVVLTAGLALDDLSIGVAHDDRRAARRSTITAVRIPGVAASGFWEAAIALASGEPEHPEIRLDLADGECFLSVEGSMKSEVIHPSGDTVWLVSARDGATLEGIMADLPASVDAMATADLAEAFPSQLEGHPVEVEILTGPDLVASLDPDDDRGAATIERAESLVSSVDASLDDLTIGTGHEVRQDGRPTTIMAVRVRDGAAWDFFRSAVRLLSSDIERPEFVMATICGTGILGVKDTSTPDADPVIVYPTGDTVWLADIPDLISTGDLERLSWVVHSLPPVAPGESSVTPVVDLKDVFPSGAGGQPWRPGDGYRIASGAEVIPLVAPLPFNIDLGDRAAAAFLRTGARLDDLTVAIGMAGEHPDVLLVALQLASEDETVMRTHLEEALLPEVIRFLGGDVRQDREVVAGKEVLRVWDAKRPKRDNLSATKPLLLHVSGDTIWAVFARKGEVVKELLGQLPS